MIKFISVALAALALSMGAQAADKNCKADADCPSGNVCVLAANPPVCKPPQPAGSPCKRDVVCASNKCELSDGKDVGVCK